MSQTAEGGSGDVNQGDPQTMLNMLTELANITDYEAALEHIEIIADTIDNICEVINMGMDTKSSSDSLSGDRASDFLLDHDVVGLFLKMLKSPCEEVVKLTLNGLDKLIANGEISKHIVKSGGFAVLTEVFIQTTEDEYLKTKASDVITYLIAPSEHKRLKIEILDNGVYSAHVAMLMSANEEYVERAAQFLWCMTDNCDVAQVKIAESTEVIDKLLRTIAESDVGRNSLRVMLNLVKSEQARNHLPKKQILLLVKTILKIPDEHMSEKDKSIAAIVFGYLYDKEMDVDQSLTVRFADLLYDSLYGEGRASHSIHDILQGISNFTGNPKVITRLADFTIVKTLLSVFALEEDFAESKGIQNLAHAKVLASRIILAFSEDSAVMEQQTEGLIDEDTTEIFHILIDSPDQELADNITKILRNVARFAHEQKKKQQAAKLAEIAAKMAEEDRKAKEAQSTPVELQVPKEIPDSENRSGSRSRSSSQSNVGTRSRSSSNTEPLAPTTTATSTSAPRSRSSSAADPPTNKPRSRASSNADAEPPKQASPRPSSSLSSSSIPEDSNPSIAVSRPKTPVAGSENESVVHPEAVPASSAHVEARPRSPVHMDDGRPRTPVHMDVVRPRSPANADGITRPRSRSRSSSQSETEQGLKTVITEVVQIDSSGTVDTISIEKSHFDDNEMLVKSELLRAAVNHNTNTIKVNETEVSVDGGETTVMNTREVVIPTEGMSDYIRTAPPFDPSHMVDNIVASALDTLGRKVDERLREVADEEERAGNAKYTDEHHRAVPKRYGLEDAENGVETHQYVSSNPPHLDNHAALHSQRISAWQYDDVSIWLKKIGLAHITDNFTKNRINGAALLEIKRRVDDAKFIRLLAEKTNVDCFGDLLVICHELRKLGQ